MLVCQPHEGKGMLGSVALELVLWRTSRMSQAKSNSLS